MTDTPECIICFQEILPEHQCRTDCNHVFCEDCVEEMFHRGMTHCPMCRKQIQQISIREEIRTIVRIYEPTLPQRMYLNTPYRLRFVMSLGLVFTCISLCYFTYHIWKSHYTLSEMRTQLKICEETLRHSTQIQETQDIHESN